MAIDSAGTKPGLSPSPDEPKKYNLRCRRPGCDGMQAVELTQPNVHGRHIYRCVKCNMTWGVATGGSFEF